MLIGINWIDLVIFLFLWLTAMQGFYSGLIKTVFSIIGVTAGLLVAFNYYAIGSSYFLKHIALPVFITDLLCFIIIFSCISLVIHYSGYYLSSLAKLRLFRFLDKTGGFFAGLILGLVVCGVILIVLTTFPTFNSMHDHVESSALAPPIMDAAAGLYNELANVLPVDLPELFFYPEEMDDYLHTLGHLIEQRGINFSALDNSTCFVCDGHVSFTGYHNNNRGSISPKFICNNCGRSSDGCQTYEGYHLMYEQCPVELGNIGYRFDCGIWSNNSYHRPVGPCPVCASGN